MWRITPQTQRGQVTHYPIGLLTEGDAYNPTNRNWTSDTLPPKQIGNRWHSNPTTQTERWQLKHHLHKKKGDRWRITLQTERGQQTQNPTNREREDKWHITLQTERRQVTHYFTNRERTGDALPTNRERTGDTLPHKQRADSWHITSQTERGQVTHYPTNRDRERTGDALPYK